MTLHNQLIVGALLFVLGLIGFLTRRNLILMILSGELMLHGVSVNLTALGRYHHSASGQIFTIFVLTIAACEAGLALALVLTLYQRRKSLDVFLWGNLRETERPAAERTGPPPIDHPTGPDFPPLAPTGRVPKLPVGAGSKT